MTKNIKNIILTRPADRIVDIKSKLENLNYNVISIPCLEIKLLSHPVMVTKNKESNTKKANTSSISLYKIIIFVSVNAVNSFFKTYSRSDISNTTKIMAIGSATAKALYNNKIIEVIYPKSEFEQTSEYFVKLPELASITAKSILLVRGNTSREYISKYLLSKQATLDELIVYKSLEPNNLKNNLIEKLSFLLVKTKSTRHCEPAKQGVAIQDDKTRLLRSARNDATSVFVDNSLSNKTIIIITSVSILKNLVNNLNKDLADVIRSCYILVPSTRIAGIASCVAFDNILNSNTMHEDSIINLINNIK